MIRDLEGRGGVARRALGLAALAFCLAAVTASSGCRRRPHVKGTVAVDTVLEAWQAEGFDIEAVENVKPTPWSAGACSQGPVAGLEVLMCEYAADAELAAGQQQVRQTWNQQNAKTGVVARNSRTLLAITDQNLVDPTGRTIIRLVRMFRDIKETR